MTKAQIALIVEIGRVAAMNASPADARRIIELVEVVTEEARLENERLKSLQLSDR